MEYLLEFNKIIGLSFKEIDKDNFNEFKDNGFIVYNHQLDFYNTSGKHPVTNAQLQPVTKDIIKTIYVEKNSFNKKEQSLIKISDNSSLINSKDKKEISVFIFDSLNKNLISWLIPKRSLRLTQTFGLLHNDSYPIR